MYRIVIAAIALIAAGVGTASAHGYHGNGHHRHFGQGHHGHGRVIVQPRRPHFWSRYHNWNRHRGW